MGIYLYGVQGVECSNHSVPTKKLQRIQSLSGDWIFYGLRILSESVFTPLFTPPSSGGRKLTFQEVSSLFATALLIFV